MLIRPMTAADAEELAEHNARFFPGSGEGGVHFMPFDVRSGDLPKGPDFEALELPLTEPGWQRWFVAIDEDVGIVGDAQLRGSTIRSGLHRCVLGIGLEKDWRGQGLGEQLMLTLIDFARKAPTLDWIDLGVFSGNPRAQALYEKLGFVVVGRREDYFRIGADSVADILMTLSVSSQS